MHARCPISAGFGHYGLPCQASFLQDPGDPSDHLRSRSLFPSRMRSLSQDSFILGETCTDTGAHHTSNSLNIPCEWKRCWLRYHTRYWTSPLWKLIPVDSLWPLKFLDIQLRKIRKQVFFSFLFFLLFCLETPKTPCFMYFFLYSNQSFKHCLTYQLCFGYMYCHSVFTFQKWHSTCILESMNQIMEMELRHKAGKNDTVTRCKMKITHTHFNLKLEVEVQKVQLFGVCDTCPI